MRVAIPKQIVIGRNKYIQTHARVPKLHTSWELERRTIIAKVRISKSIDIEEVQKLKVTIAQARRPSITQKRYKKEAHFHQDHPCRQNIHPTYPKKRNFQRHIFAYSSTALLSARILTSIVAFDVCCKMHRDAVKTSQNTLQIGKETADADPIPYV